MAARMALRFSFFSSLERGPLKLKSYSGSTSACARCSASRSCNSKFSSQLNASLYRSKELPSAGQSGLALRALLRQPLLQESEFVHLTSGNQILR